LANYSPKAQAILVEAQKIARAHQHQAIEPEHLLRALLSDDGGKAVLERLGTKIGEIEQKLEVELTKMPKVAGASNYLSPRFLKVTAQAEAQHTKVGSKLVDASPLLAALADPTSSAGAPGRLLRDHGASKDRIESALKVTTKGGAVVEDKATDGSALSKYA